LGGTQPTDGPRATSKKPLTNVDDRKLLLDAYKSINDFLAFLRAPDFKAPAIGHLLYEPPLRIPKVDRPTHCQVLLDRSFDRGLASLLDTLRPNGKAFAFVGLRGRVF